MRAWKSSILSKTIARPRCCSRCGEAAAGLMMAPSGARLPRSTAMPPSASSGSASGPDDLGVPDVRGVEVVDERLAGDGEGRRVEQVAHLAQHREQAAGAVEVLHQEPAGRLQVDQQRDVRADPVEIVEGQVDPEPPGDRQQVDDGVGGPADGGQRHDRVGERSPA